MVVILTMGRWALDGFGHGRGSPCIGKAIAGLELHVPMGNLLYVVPPSKQRVAFLSQPSECGSTKRLGWIDTHDPGKHLYMSLLVVVRSRLMVLYVSGMHGYLVYGPCFYSLHSLVFGATIGSTGQIFLTVC